MADPLEVLHALVALKDGPRDEGYRAAKDGVWQQARDLLAAAEPAPDPSLVKMVLEIEISYLWPAGAPDTEIHRAVDVLKAEIHKTATVARVGYGVRPSR